MKINIKSSLTVFALAVCFPALPLFASCNAPANRIEAENCLTGTPQNQWDTFGAGDSTIQGFATDISVNVGQTISFKINTDAASYRIDIYRMGYYGGNGARLVASIQPSAPLPQVQPPCLSDSTVGLVDCGNWATSASWQVPANSVSGIYFAHLVRDDTGDNSHIVFVVRDDSSHSAMLFQTADETWQAYNGYGGGSFYGPDQQFNINQRAYKISYNRPVDTRGFASESATWVFGAEYPMVRFLEANGYDVSYFSGIDAARFGNEIVNHKIYLTVGHDEYWSGSHRANVEAARDAGVNMAFFSGNEVFWKTRLEPSIDGSGTPNRTLVCYKETLAGTPIDPLDPPTWTGTWRDGRFSPPADGGRPENSLTGTLFLVNGPGTDNPGTQSIKVPYADGQMRFWRNTTVANLIAGQTATLPKGTLGYEWDGDVDNGFRPAGLVHLSTATYSLTTDLLLDQGATFGAGSATHHLTLYRAPSGALVFGAGTVQWSWGLDDTHDNPFFPTNTAPNKAMQQATVNLFADMGVQPATLISGLVPAVGTTDTTAPHSTITWPTNGTTLATGSSVTVTGTAADAGGGVVGAVEVSTDGGNSWHPANGRENWTYNWRPAALGSFQLRSRASDDSANVEISSGTASVITVNPPDCPCSDWSSTTTPATVDGGDSTPGEYGVRFRSDFDGYITAIRFYKASTNTGTHIGNLWSNTGALLATVRFTNETASGWQQATFSNPVAITAGTTYVASYFAPAGHYSVNLSYFGQGIDNPPLHFPADGVSGANGIFSYSGSSTFPTSSYRSSNYWVDVVYIPSSSMPGAKPALLVLPSHLSFSALSGSLNPSPQTVAVYNEGDGTLNWTATSNVTWMTVTPSGTTPGNLTVSVDASGLAGGTYTGTITVSSPTATNAPQQIPVSFTVSHLLLSSDFSSGTTAGWAVSPLGLGSNWSVSGGVLTYNGGGHTQLYTGNSAWTDYNLNLQFKLATLNDYPGGIRGHLDLQSGAGYAVWLYPAEGLIKLFRNAGWNIDSGVVLLGQRSVGFDTANFHNLSLSFTGSQIQVSYDGNDVIDATDSAYSQGGIALDVSSQMIGFTNVTVTSSNANSGSITPGTTSLTYTANYHSANPAPQAVPLTATSGALVWTATSSDAWLSVSPAYGVTPSTLQVSVASAALDPGTYSGTITVVSPGAVSTTQTINVNLTVAAPAPQLVVSPAPLNFFAVSGQSVPAQSLAVTNGGGFGSFSWSASSDSIWLQASPASGSTPQNMTVSVNPSGLAPGSYSGNLTISAAGIANSPQTVPVTLQVLSSAMTETFTDLGTGWIVSPMGLANGWNVSGGVYSYSGLGFSQSCAGNSAWSDYKFDTNIQLSSLSNWPGGVRGRVNPATGAGYAVWLYPASGQVMLYSVAGWDINGSGTTLLAHAPLGFDLTAAHDLALDFRGNVISVFWDGSFILSATDSSHTSGFVCLDADSQPVSYSNVRVSAVQSAVTLDTPSPSSLVFSAVGGSAPQPQAVNITAGGANTSWAASTNVSWLKAIPSTTLTPGSLSVSADPTGLADGSYSGTITVSAPGATNSPVQIPVTMAVRSAALGVAPQALTFFGAVGLNPAPQLLHVSNLGTGTLTWTAGSPASWITLSSSSGTAPASITVTANASTGVGAFNDAVTVTASGAANSPTTIPVSMQVGSLLFRDDFSSGAGNWSFSPSGNASGWSVVNGTYVYNGQGPSQSFAGNTAWTDYTVSADFQLSSTLNYPGGLRGRVNAVSGASYGVWIYPGQQVLKLFRIGQWNIDADLSLLGQSGTLPMDTAWHNLRLVFQGSTIQVYYDNALAITSSDSSYSQGGVALDVSNQPIAFDNVTVISLP